MTQTQTKVNYLKEWSPSQFITVERAIFKFLRSRFWTSEKSPDADPFIKLGLSASYSRMADYLGLAYTSSSSIAGYWACNDNLYLDNQQNYWLVGFGLDANSFVHAIFWDKDENEISFPIN